MAQQRGHRLQAILVGHFVEPLANLVALVLLQQFDGARLVQELPPQLLDAFGIGGGKQQGLALERTLPRDEHHVVVKAHVQHAVGFVEHQRVERIQIQAAALQVIHDAARRADHDVRAVFQAGHLRAHRAAAHQRQHLDVVLGARQAADLLRHLIGQLARRAQHQRLHVKMAQVQIRQQRQREGRGLAATGLGLRDQVMTFQRDRQAGRLDRRHVEVAQLAQIRQHGGRQRQLIERGAESRIGRFSRGGQ